MHEHSNSTDKPWRVMIHTGDPRGYWRSALTGTKGVTSHHYHRLIQEWDLDNGAVLLLDNDGHRIGEAGNLELLGREP